MLAGLLAACELSGTADAALIQFNISGFDNLSFQIDDSKDPDAFNLDTVFYFGASGRYGGGDTNGLANIRFYTDDGGGGLVINDDTGPNGDNGGILFSSFGPQLFTGSVSAPKFALGTYKLPQAPTNPSGGDGTVTLTISNAVPEPATWATMIGGVGMAGGMLRRRRKTKVRVAYV